MRFLLEHASRLTASWVVGIFAAAALAAAYVVVAQHLLGRGRILISIAATRAGTVPRWVIALGVLALVGDFSPTNDNTVIHAAFATLVFGFIASRLRQPVVTENPSWVTSILGTSCAQSTASSSRLSAAPRHVPT